MDNLICERFAKFLAVRANMFEIFRKKPIKVEAFLF
jgi:hypothetical protein